MFDNLPKAEETYSDSMDVFAPMPRLDGPVPKSSHSKVRQQKKKEDDDALRQSLNALEQSNRENRGRLRAGRRAKKAEELQFEDSLEVPKTNDIVITKSDADKIETTTLNQLAVARGETSRLDELTSPLIELNPVISTSSSTSKSGDKQDKKLQKRSEKIDQVQETVRSALANLAGMMANINAPPKTVNEGYAPSPGIAKSGIRVSPLTVVNEEKKIGNEYISTINNSNTD